MALQNIPARVEEKFDAVGPQKLASGLGYFSIGLGLAELLTPKLVAFICGVESKNAPLIQLFGMREIAAGIGIFSQGKRPAESMWLRVAGDALDLTALSLAALSPKTDKVRWGVATASVVAVTVLDYLTAENLSKDKGVIDSEGSVHVTKSIFINKTPDECYKYWRNLENLPTFMRHLRSVKVSGEGRTHWVAKGPGGVRVSWDAEVIDDRPNESIVWRSLPGSLISNRGSVTFEPAPAGRGTYVIVDLAYAPPAGMVGVGVAKLFREEPSSQLKDDLYRFKQIMEVGEVILSDGSPRGNGDIRQHPGQPVAGWQS